MRRCHSFSQQKRYQFFYPLPPPPLSPPTDDLCLLLFLQDEGKLFFDKAKEDIYEQKL